MGRLSKRESAMLEALEGAAGLLGVGMRYDLQLLAIRLRDLGRRVPEYGQLVGYAQEALEGCEEARGRAHGQVAEVLRLWQEEREA